MKKKIGHVEFDYNEEFRGEVVVSKGTSSIRVPVEALRAFVAESVRVELASHIQRMKPADLLRRIA